MQMNHHHAAWAGGMVSLGSWSSLAAGRRAGCVLGLREQRRLLGGSSRTSKETKMALRLPRPLPPCAALLGEAAGGGSLSLLLARLHGWGAGGLGGGGRGELGGCH